MHGMFQSIKDHPDMITHLDETGKILERHIRKEERELFPLIEESCVEQLIGKIDKLLTALSSPTHCYFFVGGGSGTPSISCIIPLDTGMLAMTGAVPFTIIFPPFLVMVISPPFTCPITWPSINFRL